MTEERAIAFLKSKGIPFDNLSVSFDGASFKHPNKECYKHDWGTPITIEVEGNRCGDVIQKCNAPLCSETKFLEPRIHEWGDFYIKDYDYGNGEFHSTQMSQECEHCGKERRGHGGGKVMWDFEAEESYSAEDKREKANRLINKVLNMVIKDVWNHFQMNDDDTLDDYLESPPEMLYTDSTRTHLKYSKYIFVHSADWDVEYGHYDGDYEPGYFQPTYESNQRAIKLEEKLRAKYNTKAISINLENSYNRNHKYGVEVSYNAETLLAAEGSEEEELSKEQLSAYFARLKDQNPDLAKEIEYSVKEQSYLPRVDINKAGFDDDIIEAWVDLVAVEDDKYAPFERCDECEGEGYVLTSYTSATRFEPADGDGEDCSYCEGTGEIDPAEYMYSNDDGKVGYLAENAEYDEEDMVFCNHCSDIVGNEKEVYGDETVEYEMANGELVCIPCHKIWMKEYKNDLDPHYSPFYAESFIKSHYVWGVGIFALTLGLLSRKR